MCSGAPVLGAPVLQCSGAPVNCGSIGILQKSPVQNLTSELQFDQSGSQPHGEGGAIISPNGYGSSTCITRWPNISEVGHHLRT